MNHPAGQLNSSPEQFRLPAITACADYCPARAESGQGGQGYGVGNRGQRGRRTDLGASQGVNGLCASVALRASR
jgi:hypothetical protein